MSRIAAFLNELKRRRVYHVGIAYAAAALVVAQAADTFLPRLGAPDRIVSLVIILVAAGFPVALVLGWAFDITADGVRRAESTPDAAPARRGVLWITVTAAMSALVLVATVWAISKIAFPPPPLIETIAILPFTNLSGDVGQDYFVDGMHDAVVAQLGSLGAFKVIGRTSVARYRNTTMSVRAIAPELGADALVEGTVVQADGRVRITARLINGSDDRTLWSDSYVREVRDILMLQSEIAGAIAGEIGLSLGTAARQRLASVAAGSSIASPDSAAYDRYLRGRYHLGQAPSGSEQAVRYFEEAIAMDSTFALPYAALAEAYWWSELGSPLLQERVAAATRAAVRLDPRSADAHIALGIMRMHDWDWGGSEAAFRKALELNPSSAAAHQWYAQLLRQMMRLDEAAREARLALELDPFSLTVRTMVGWVLFNQREYDEAFDVWKGVLELDPGFGLAIYNQGLVYWMKGMGEEVITAGQEARTARLPVMDIHADLLLTVGYALTGQPDSARIRLREREFPPGLAAAVHHVLGDDDEALNALEQAVASRRSGVAMITSEPLFDDLREHPRFRALRSTMGLP